MTLLWIRPDTRIPLSAERLRQTTDGRDTYDGAPPYNAYLETLVKKGCKSASSSPLISARARLPFSAVPTYFMVSNANIERICLSEPEMFLGVAFSSDFCLLPYSFIPNEPERSFYPQLSKMEEMNYNRFFLFLRIFFHFTIVIFTGITFHRKQFFKSSTSKCLFFIFTILI